MLREAHKESKSGGQTGLFPIRLPFTCNPRWMAAEFPRAIFLALGSNYSGLDLVREFTSNSVDRTCPEQHSLTPAPWNSRWRGLQLWRPWPPARWWPQPWCCPMQAHGAHPTASPLCWRLSAFWSLATPWPGDRDCRTRISFTAWWNRNCGGGMEILESTRTCVRTPARPFLRCVALPPFKAASTEKFPHHFQLFPSR